MSIKANYRKGTILIKILAEENIPVHHGNSRNQCHFLRILYLCHFVKFLHFDNNLRCRPFCHKFHLFVSRDSHMIIEIKGSSQTRKMKIYNKVFISINISMLIICK